MVEARAYAPGVREIIRWRILPGAGAFQRLSMVFSTVISARFGVPGASRGSRRAARGPFFPMPSRALSRSCVAEEVTEQRAFGHLRVFVALVA